MSSPTCHFRYLARLTRLDPALLSDDELEAYEAHVDELLGRADAALARLSAVLAARSGR